MKELKSQFDKLKMSSRTGKERPAASGAPGDGEANHAADGAGPLRASSPKPRSSSESAVAEEAAEEDVSPEEMDAAADKLKDALGRLKNVSPPLEKVCLELRGAVDEQKHKAQEARARARQSEKAADAASG